MLPEFNFGYFSLKMEMSKKEKKALVRRDRFLKFRSLNGLFKTLINLCQLLVNDQHFDYCYCNISFKQCWMCNFANFVRQNRILEQLLQNKQNEDCVIGIAYRLLFYIKRIRNDGLDGDDRKWVLDFFNQKFKAS